MVSRTLLSLLGLGLAVRAAPSLRTQAGSVIVSVNKSDGGDFGVRNAATGVTETWSDMKARDIATSDALGTVEQMLGLSRRQGPADPSAGPSLPTLIGGMITKLDEVLNATEANGAAAAAAAGPFYTVAYPFEVGSVGGDMIKIGGYNFIPGIAIYTSTWTYTAPSGETTVVESEPTAATSMNLLEVEAPAWPHQPAQTEYIGALTISQAGVMIPSLTPVVTTFQAMVPTMTDLSGNLQVQDVSGNSWRFNVTVADVDSDVSDVRITATATNSSFVTSIRDISSDMSSENRTLEVILPNSDGCGQSNVTITITDNLGLRSNQTFELFISCSSWVPIVRTAGSRSNYGTFGYGIDQMRSRLVADTGTNIGAFRAISTQTGARYIRITKLSGTRDVGTYAIFRLVAPLSGSVLATMFGCGVTNAYTRSPSTTQWTAAYSGQKVDGTLPLYNRYNQRQSLRYVFICGINMSADDDHSLLAFTYRTGYSNDWSDSWRGQSQRGTVWSLYNDDYKGGRGWRSVQSGPGYKAGSWNQGSYQIDISTATSL